MHRRWRTKRSIVCCVWNLSIAVSLPRPRSQPQASPPKNKAEHRNSLLITKTRWRRKQGILSYLQIKRVWIFIRRCINIFNALWQKWLFTYKNTKNNKDKSVFAASDQLHRFEGTRFWRSQCARKLEELMEVIILPLKSKTLYTTCTT